MLIGVKIVNWLAIALLVVERAPIVMPTLVAALPYGLALYAFRSDRTERERWGAAAVNIIGVLYYSWYTLANVMGSDPAGLYGIAVFLAFNVLPCMLNTVFLVREFISAPDLPPPHETHSRGNW